MTVPCLVLGVILSRLSIRLGVTIQRALQHLENLHQENTYLGSQIAAQAHFCHASAREPQQVRSAAMIPPSQLPSADSLDGLAVATPDSDPTTLVCSAACGGVRCAPHWAQRFATARCYFTALLALSLLLGAARGYLAGLAYLIGDLYGLPDVAIDWLLVGAETVQGLAALWVAHGGARAHRPSWIGAPVFLHAGSCFAALVSFSMHSDAHPLIPSRNSTNEWLCEVIAPVVAPQENKICWVTLVLLVIVQLTAGIAWAALLIHGIAYLDDNVDNTDSPALLGAFLGADKLGQPLGQVVAYACTAGNSDVWTTGELSKIWWLGWPLFGGLLLVMSVLISMFPKRLPSAAVRERANNILEVVCGRVRIDDRPQDIDLHPGLLKTMKRLVRNKMITFMTLFLMLLYMPLHFFAQYENRYLESVYFIPEPEYSGGVFKDQWTSRVTTGFMKPPIVLMTMLLSGMVISRKRPRPSALAIWNVGVTVTAALIVFVFIFLRCPFYIHGLEGNNLQLDESCNYPCACPGDIPFLPVCDRNGIGTYYSPCHAGCTRVDYIDDLKLYYDCKCLKYEKKAKGGACSYSTCTTKWVVFQSLGVLISALVGTCIVGSILLCLRSVAVVDKMHALAFVIMHIGATHLPGKFIYKAVTDATCIYWGDGNYHCQLFDPSALALWFNILTGGLLLLAAGFGLLAWRHSKDIRLFKDNLDEPDTREMNELRQKLNARLATPYTRRKRRENNESSVSDRAESEGNEENRNLDNVNESEEEETQPLQQQRENINVHQSENNELSENDEPIENDEQSEVNEESENNNRRVWRATIV